MNAGIETPRNRPPPNQIAGIDTQTSRDGREDGENRIPYVVGYTKSTHVRPYKRPLPTSIFTMSANHPHTKIRPFRQRIQISGPSQYAVRATAQVDDGAMRNCIGLHIWESYGHCLGPLSPTDTRVSVANNTEVSCTGAWSGDINLGGMKFHTHFVIFDCQGAFDIILGKPWLLEARAVHHYATDTITVSTDTESAVIGNVEHMDQQSPPQAITAKDPITPPTPNTATLDDLIRDEVHRIEVLRNTDGPFAESRWARYLDVETMVDDDEEPSERPKSTGVEWFTTRAEQRSIERAKQKERRADNRKRRTEILEWLSREAQATEDKKSDPDVANNTQPHTANKHKSNKEYADHWRKRRTMIAIIQNCQDTDTDPLDVATAHTLIDSERRITSLRSKLTHLRRIAAEHQPPDTPQNTPIHMANAVTSQDFTIDRGENTTTRISNPFETQRVDEILNKIELGPDLTDDQRERIRTLIQDYADVFAISLSEVRVVDWHKHHLNIDTSVKLPTRVSQRPITEAQKDWFFSILDEMEDAHVIQKVPSTFIKAISSTNLAPKEAGKIGATRTEILRKVNAECIKNGLPPFWEEVREPGETDEAMLEAVENVEEKEIKTKWRVCHAFTALNKATQVPSFPQGNLKAKQEFAAGHRWASVIDFSAGYYAVPLDDESVPYVAFYVEGRGHYVYLRMPFGLTGAPATFCEMVAIALEDMIGRELVNWMDDICLPGDDFNTKLANLRKFFTRCRDKGLSLSPSKTKLFFTDVLFAGTMVGPDGIKPNLDKVSAVANWPVPQDVQDLMGFLGLTNYFRRLICDYGRIARPLSDLTRDIKVDLPKYGAKAKKGAYKRALKAASLKDKWGPDQQKAFVTLKVLLSQEPVLKPPQYDGRPFRVTSDGSSTGLAGYLSQPFSYTDSAGREQTRWHPISYCSKRTSRSEERYEPFLLEFAALKFCLDEFDPYIYGSPIEIETDCQALRDCLLKEKISTHHSRWKESILAHNIIDIRHRPGVENAVADGLS